MKTQNKKQAPALTRPAVALIAAFQRVGCPGDRPGETGKEEKKMNPNEDVREEEAREYREKVLDYVAQREDDDAAEMSYAELRAE